MYTQCPKCHNTRPISVKECPYCHVDSSRQQKPANKKCRYCRELIYSEAILCPHCRKPAKTATSTKIIAAIFAGITGLMIFSPVQKEIAPPSAAWSTDSKIEILRTLDQNNIHGCGIVEWQPSTEHNMYYVKCSNDNQNWDTYQVWTAINAVNRY